MSLQVRTRGIGSTDRARPEKGQMDDVRRYQYLPLENERTVRLITLRSARSKNQPLVCILFHASLDNPPPYAALSYEWRGEEPQLPMTCQDGSTILLMPNCYAALRRIRCYRKRMYLWIDAVCIAQNDLGERNHQVSMMFDIYRLARFTYVWLGDEDPNSDHALKFARRVSFIGRHRTLQKLPAKVRRRWEISCPTQAIIALANRSYWYRIWTVQEFVASTPVLFCGAAREILGLDAFAVINRFAQTWPWKEQAALYRANLYYDWHETIRRLPLLSSGYTDVSRMYSSDKRDKVFALKGLFPDALQELEIDYEKPIWDTYAEATRLTIENERSLKMLDFVAWPSGDVSLPSWAVDWDYKFAWYFTNFKASNESRPIYRFSDDRRKLYLTGKIIREVATDAGDSFPQLDSISNSFVFEGSHIEDHMHTPMCMRVIHKFYRKTASSIFPDFVEYFLRVLKAIDPDDYYNIPARMVLDPIKEEGEAVALSKLETGDLLFVLPFTGNINNTALFMTAEGEIGVARRNGLRRGDKIALVAGMNKPVILRQVGIELFLLISTAVVPGMLNGEMWPDDAASLQEFVIV